MPPKKSPPVVGQADGNRSWDQLKGADPRRHYVYANPTSGDIGSVGYYEAIGYEIERHREGGPRPAFGGRMVDGEPITAMGQVLMSLDGDKHAAIVEHGIGGGGGQAATRVIEKRIVKSGGIDSLRGMAGVYDVINETSPETRG